MFALVLLIASLAAAQPDLTACNGQVVCTPSSTLLTMTPFAVSFASNYFSAPLNITLFAGTTDASSQQLCRTTTNSIIQEWSVASSQIKSTQGLGYVMLTASQQATVGFQSVFIRLSSDSSTPLGNCFIGTAPLTLTQARPALIVPTSIDPFQSKPTNNSSEASTTTVISSSISYNLTILIACSAAAVFLAILSILFALLFIRKRRLRRKSYLDESLVKRDLNDDSAASSEVTNAPLIAFTPPSTPPPCSNCQSTSPHFNEYSCASTPTSQRETTSFQRESLLRSNTLSRSITQINISDAHLIADAFKKELSDPQATIGNWDASSAETDSIRDGGMDRRHTEKSQGSSQLGLTPISNLGLDRIV